MPQDTAPADLTGSYTPHQRRRIWNPEINGGDMITLVAMLITGFGAFTNLDKNQARTADRVTVIEERAREQQAGNKEALAELKADVKVMQRTLDDIKAGLPRK